MTENADITKMESSIENEFLEAFSNATKGKSKKQHQEVLTSLLKDYKQKVIDQGQDIKQDQLLTYPN